MSLDENLNRVLSRYDELQALMSAEEAPAAVEIARLSKEFSDLTPVVQAVNELKSARDEAFDLTDLSDLGGVACWPLGWTYDLAKEFIRNG